MSVVPVMPKVGQTVALHAIQKSFSALPVFCALFSPTLCKHGTDVCGELGICGFEVM